MSRSLIVLPNDSVDPFIGLIDAAGRSLRIKMFSLSDERVLAALIRAHRRGVKIRVMLNQARRSGQSQNKGSRSTLRGAGIDVLDTSPAVDVTHEKSMVVEDNTAIIASLNMDAEVFNGTREFAIVTKDAQEVREVIDCFEADWSRRIFTPPKASNLIWCPGPGRKQIADFIDTAQHTLFVQNERFQDAIIVERLVRAKLRGVKVHVMTRPSHSLRAEKLVEGIGDMRIMQDVGIEIHKIKHLRLHAKMLLADKSRAVVGSINLTTSSFDKRRELAIHLKDRDVIARLSKVVHEDWENSRRLDLTDEGILADLKKHPKEEVAGLTASASEYAE